MLELPHLWLMLVKVAFSYLYKELGINYESQVTRSKRVNK